MGTIPTPHYFQYNYYSPETAKTRGSQAAPGKGDAFRFHPRKEDCIVPTGLEFSSILIWEYAKVSILVVSANFDDIDLKLIIGIDNFGIVPSQTETWSGTGPRDR